MSKIIIEAFSEEVISANREPALSEYKEMRKRYLLYSLRSTQQLRRTGRPTAAEDFLNEYLNWQNPAGTAFSHFLARRTKRKKEQGE